jgi:hypothetical protein
MTRTLADYLANPDAGLAQSLSDLLGYIDPHLPPFNARGDAFNAFDGVGYGTNKFASRSYTFTSADVGKPFYCASLGPIRRTVASVNPGGEPHSCMLDAVLPRGADLDWIIGSDDTAALQAALDAAGSDASGRSTGSADNSQNGATFGRKVLLRSGRNYLVRNTAENFGSGPDNLAALVVRRRSTLAGQGWNSRIFVSPDSYGHAITNEGAGRPGTPWPDRAYADFMQLADFGLNCFGNYGGKNGLDGIHWAVSFDGYLYVDAYNRIQNVFVWDAQRDGFYLSGRGEFFMSGCTSYHARRYGYHFRKLLDGNVVQSHSGGAEMTGIRVFGCNGLRFTGCKSFFCGRNGGVNDEDSAAWVLESDDGAGFVTLVNCEGQETRGSSVVISTGNNSFQAFRATDPGRNNPMLSSGELPAIRAGFHLKGGARSNEINGVPQAGVQYTQTPNFTGTHALYIGGNVRDTFGDVFVQPEILATIEKPVAVTGIERNDAIVVVSPGHGLATDDLVRLWGQDGAAALEGRPVRVRAIDKDRFALVDVPLAGFDSGQPFKRFTKCPQGGLGAVNGRNRLARVDRVAMT